MSGIKFLDATDVFFGLGTGHVELKYGAVDAERGFFSGIPTLGMVRGFICPNCGQIRLYVTPGGGE
jgi:hypothetical protein